jgi:hypothetical protein
MPAFILPWVTALSRSGSSGGVRSFGSRNALDFVVPGESHRVPRVHVEFPVEFPADHWYRGSRSRGPALPQILFPVCSILAHVTELDLSADRRTLALEEAAVHEDELT